MRRAFAAVVLALAVLMVLAAAPAAIAENDGTATTTTIDNSFLDTERDLSDCLNSSVELPGCGRQPTNAGDRGGALQLATFVVMGLGLVFIGWRVTRAVRARDAALGQRPT